MAIPTITEVATAGTLLVLDGEAVLVLIGAVECSHIGSSKLLISTGQLGSKVTTESPLEREGSVLIQCIIISTSTFDDVDFTLLILALYTRCKGKFMSQISSSFVTNCCLNPH